MPGREGREPFPRREFPPLTPITSPGQTDPGAIIPVISGPQTGGPEPPVVRQHGGGGVAPAPVDPEPTQPDELPLPPIPPPPNSPLAIQGTFAIPGTPNAQPFRTSTFFQNRVVRGPQREGPGTTLLGGASGFSGLAGDTGGGDVGAQTQNSEEDLIRRIVLGLGRGRR